MGTLLAVISVIAIYASYPALFERPGLKRDTSFPFGAAHKATFVNRSDLTAAGVQAMYFFGTGTLQAGMLFYMKYSLKVEEAMATVPTAKLKAGVPNAFPEYFQFEKMDLPLATRAYEPEAVWLDESVFRAG